MSGLESLYQELILDHSKHPHGKGLRGDDSAPTSHQRNPICGDEITLRARVEDGVVKDVTWDGAGCSISQASASMLAALIEEDGGIPREQAASLIDGFRTALRSRGTVALDEETFSEAAALSGVSKYTARVKCAMLPWVALEDVLSRS